MTVLAILIAAGTGASWLLTAGVRRYALAKSVLDVPNARSSHTVPTPRGGGLAIALVSLGGIGGLAVADVISVELAIAVCGGGLLVATVGWIDDHRGVPAAVRAAVHFLAAAWALFWLGGFQSLNLGAVILDLGPLGTLLALLGTVWFINLFNFMDGIDGIAGGEALSVGVIGGMLLIAQGETGLAAVAFLVAGASAGFLFWNWSPAKIFMGDIGSSFLGFLFAVLAVASESAGAVPVLVWVLLLGVFIFDATVTLLRRVRCRERWYEAHRSHGYQRAVDAGLSHVMVSSVVIGTTVILGGLAAVSTLRPAFLLPCLLAGLLLLVSLYRAVERSCPMKCR